jgi:hypothetical protein
MAGRILAGCVAFVSASARAASDGAAALTARLHDLMLEAARLSADAADAAGGSGGAPPADARGGDGRTLRRVLSERNSARRDRAAGGGDGDAAGQLAPFVGPPLAPLGGSGAAGPAKGVPSGFTTELAAPWTWDVTQPLTLLSDGTPVRARGARAAGACGTIRCHSGHRPSPPLLAPLAPRPSACPAAAPGAAVCWHGCAPPAACRDRAARRGACRGVDGGKPLRRQHAAAAAPRVGGLARAGGARGWVAGRRPPCSAPHKPCPAAGS